jgi:outer membrane immunogenic protein
MKTMMMMMMASIAFIASVSAAAAADAGPMTPGAFAPPPAYPASQPTVTPGLFEPPPAYPVHKVHDWTGAYIGLNGGGAFGTTNWFSVPDVLGGKSNASGGLVGGTAGYNLQTADPFVVGVEADLDWSGIKATVSPLTCAPGCAFSVPYLATTRLRFGYSFNGIMPYVTGGMAIGGLKAEIIGAPYGTQATDNIGWTAGGGIEVALSDAWRAKVEYLHVDLNGFDCNVACNGGPVSFNVKGDIIRAGLNYRLWMN